MRKEFIVRDDPRFRECHASTLVVLPNGERLAAWFGGTREGAGDVGIWTARKTVEGWKKPVEVAAESRVPHWNPVLFHPDDGTLLLFYKVGWRIPEWQTRLLRSNDGGYTWNCPEELVSGDVGGRGPVKNKPLILADGTWLAPASEEDRFWDAFVDISTDRGRTWHRSDMVSLDHDNFEGPGIIQPTLWESSPNSVHMLLRSSCGYICRSDSQDGGRTWSSAYITELPNNNSGIDLAQLPDGRLVLVHNPVGADWGARTPLVVSVSDDNGVSWREVATLEDEQPPGDFAGNSPSEDGVRADGRAEFSYPAIVAYGSDIEITYTWKRRGIVHVQITGL